MLHELHIFRICQIDGGSAQCVDISNNSGGYDELEAGVGARLPTDLARRLRLP